jgi:hypothetical protein
MAYFFYHLKSPVLYSLLEGREGGRGREFNDEGEETVCSLERREVTWEASFL